MIAGEVGLVTWDELVHYVAQVVEPVAIERRLVLYSLDHVCEKVAIALQTMIGDFLVVRVKGNSHSLR